MTLGLAAQTLALHGGKPGEGKSFLARNLAAAMTAAKQRVILFDLDMSARNEQALCLGMTAKPCVADLGQVLHHLDGNTIRGYFPNTPAGWTLATLADSPAAAMAVASPTIFKLLELFQQAYDVVIVDGLQGWEPLQLKVLDRADRILLLCPPEVPGLSQVQRDIQRYQELKFPATKIGLIRNRATVPGGLALQDLKRAFAGYAVLASLPYDSRAVAATNQKCELVRLYPHSPFAKAMQNLNHELKKNLRSIQATTHLGHSLPRITPLGEPDRNAIKERIHALLLEHEEIRDLAAETSRHSASQSRLRAKVETVVTVLMAQEAPELSNREARERLVQEVVDEALGLGPLEELIRDESVTEIMVNRRDQIYVERGGKLEPWPRHFLNDKQLMTVIERIVAPLGRRIDESQPYVDARLLDGSRVNAVIPPLALQGPTLTIRKFSKHRLTIQDLLKFASLSDNMAAFIGACVKARKNIIIAGGTGTGKTTLLNVLAGFIPEHERILTIEDAAELNLPQAHVITLEARPANLEGQGAITIRDLVKNALRMRPDRIVVGECRGGEALDMLQAMNTGHDGSLTTLHANSPKDTIARLETLVLMAGMDLPVRAIREQIFGAVHVIVQQSRMQDGTRKITRLSHLAGMEDGVIELKDIFVYKPTGKDKPGVFAATGYIPGFVEEFSLHGIDLDRKIFKT